MQLADRRIFSTRSHILEFETCALNIVSVFVDVLFYVMKYDKMLLL